MTTATDQRQLALEASHELENASATEILQWAYTEFGNRLVVTSSLADTVMIHLAEQVAITSRKRWALGTPSRLFTT